MSCLASITPRRTLLPLVAVALDDRTGQLLESVERPPQRADGRAESFARHIREDMVAVDAHRRRRLVEAKGPRQVEQHERGEDVEPAAREILQRKPNLRVLAVPAAAREGLEVRAIGGGLAVQTPDSAVPDVDRWRRAGGPPQDNLLKDLEFACRIVKHARSNAIVVAKDGVTLGIGAGQVSRIRAAAAAFEQAGDEAKGAVLASDAFFPFGDVVELAATHGIAAIVEPGGSLRDDQSIEAADKSGVALYFTGTRHFRH